LFARKLWLFWSSYDRPDLLDIQFLAASGLDPWLRWPLPRFGWLAALAPLALWSLWQRSLGKPWVACVLLTWIVIALFLVNGRYRYGLIAPLAVGSGIAIVDLAAAIYAGRTRSLCGALAIVAPAALIAYWPLDAQLRLPFRELERRERPEAAAAEYRLILAERPDAPAAAEVRVRLALLIHAELPNEALTLASRALEGELDTATAALAQLVIGTIVADGTEQVAADPLRAEHHLRQAIQLDPNAPDPWLALASLQSRRDETAACVASVRRFFALRDRTALTGTDPAAHPRAQRMLAMGLYQLQRWNEAVVELEALTRIAVYQTGGPRADDMTTFLALGRTLHELGRSTDFEELLLRIDRVFPPELARELTSTLRTLGG
jgi:tetratricopeptide (TPR) repeat protein